MCNIVLKLFKTNNNDTAATYIDVAGVYKFLTLSTLIIAFSALVECFYFLLWTNIYLMGKFDKNVLTF